MSKIRLAIVGCRSFNQASYFHSILQDWISQHRKPDLIISEGLIGTGTLSKIYADQRRLPLKQYYPNWDRDGPHADLICHTQIIQDSTHILAFPSHRSTATQDIINQGIQMGRFVEIYPI